MSRLSPSSTRRSLNLPALDASSFQSALDAYTQHPEVATLDQIMLHYLEMEEILKLYRQNHERFETRQTLNTLSIRYNLPAATTFKQLLRDYDMQYATVRSYLYNNRSPLEILYQAALEGDIQAFYNQLKLYPKLRKQKNYTVALGKAAEGGHRAIMDLLLELGASKNMIFIGAARGGKLDLFKEEIVKEGKKSIKRSVLINSAYSAAKNNQMEVLAYILSLNASKTVLNHALKGAGKSQNIAMIEYLIAKGADNYKVILEDAAEKGNLEIFKKYYHKVANDSFTNMFVTAVEERHLDIVKYILEHGLVDSLAFKKMLTDLKYTYKVYVKHLNINQASTKDVANLAKDRDVLSKMIQYLELQETKNYQGSSEED